MSAVIRDPSTKAMPFAVRPLRESDIAQAKAVEKDAFPTLFPPTSFRRELKNRVAHYWVAEKRDPIGEAGVPVDSTSGVSQSSPIERIVNRARSLWSRNTDHGSDGDDIVGFLGAWYVADEAHIVSVGVRIDHLRRGIGELLLVSSIEHAMVKQIERMTLEVRPSNVAALRLYEKYGFTEHGVRKAYYSDNREDAIIMTTESIQVSPYPERLAALKRTHREHCGLAEVELGT